MISYELSLGLSLVPVVMLARSFSLVDIVGAGVPSSSSASGFSLSFVSALAEAILQFQAAMSWWLATTPNTAACVGFTSWGIRHHGNPGARWRSSFWSGWRGRAAAAISSLSVFAPHLI
jgi:hypothetical protein